MHRSKRPPFLTSERATLVGDALGALALFVLLLAALHMPFFA